LLILLKLPLPNFKEVSHQNVCETSFLRYRRLLTFAAAFIAAEALVFPVGYKDGITAIAHVK